MSNVGRPPVPTIIKALRGTLQPGERDGEPQPDGAIYVPPPTELRAEHPIACDFWESTLPLLVRNQMITEVDMTAFAAACLAFEAWTEAERELKLNGAVVKTENGYPIQSPYFSIAAQRRKEVIEYLREFGLTPSSRTRLKIQLIAPGGGSARRDEHQEFFDF